MRGLVRLQVDRTPGALRYRLELPDHDGTSLEELEHAISDDALTEANAQVGTLLRHPEVAGFGEQAAGVGQRLYRNLMPSKLREQLDDLRYPILLLTNLHEFPFELFHDGREFGGLRFAVGRRVVTRQGDRAGTPPRSLEGRHLEVLVIGSDPRGDLAYAGSEAQAVHSCLSESLGETADTCLLITSPVAGQATFDDVARRLAQGIDIFHYCGHVERRKDGSVGLLLADERLLSVDDIANNLQGAPVVFLNACASTRRAGEAAPGAWREDLASLAGAFIRAGARAVIGTLCDVSDRHAAALAEEFYRLTTSGVPLGEGLRRARSRCRDEAPGSPTWLSFILYGSPDQILLDAKSASISALDTRPDEGTRSIPWRLTRSRRALWRHRKLFGTLAALLAGLLTARSFYSHSHSGVEADLRFATALYDTTPPRCQGAVDRATLGRTVYVCVSWFGLVPRRTYRQVLTVTDPAGALVERRQGEMVAATTVYRAYFALDTNPLPSGTYVVTVYLDDMKMADKRVYLIEEDNDQAPSRGQ